MKQEQKAIITLKDMEKAIKPFHRLTECYDAQDLVKYHKGYFFVPETMRAWGTKLLDDVYPTNKDKVVFITTDKGAGGERCINIRCINLITGEIDDLMTQIGIRHRKFAQNEAVRRAYCISESIIYDGV